MGTWIDRIDRMRKEGQMEGSPIGCHEYSLFL
jgi:hypothetical protein